MIKHTNQLVTCENIHESPKHNANKQVQQRLILLHNSIYVKV